MEKDIKHYKLGNTIQEFEDLLGNTPFDDIEKIKKYLFQNYIPKSKIKEKIEELREIMWDTQTKYKSTYAGLPEWINAKAQENILIELMEDK